MAGKYTKIIIPTRPHPDIIVGIFLLSKFGQEKYPGVAQAEIEIWQQLPEGETAESLDKKGVLLLDVGSSKFDHHGSGKNLSQLIAEDLGITNEPSLKKMLNYAQRDDKYGLGTISTDILDKAFGLSGLVAALNKTEQDYQKVIKIVLPLLEAHFIEEKRRAYEMPKEFEKKLENGTAEVFEVKQKGKKIKIIVLESDNLSIAGWLKSSEGLKADVVCQRNSQGFTNILTKPLKNVDLRWLVAYLRKAEAEIRDRKLTCSTFDLMKPGKVDGVSEWYYDRATNSILNGGASPKGILPTAIPLETIKEILKEALSQDPPGSGK